MYIVYIQYKQDKQFVLSSEVILLNILINTMSKEPLFQQIKQQIKQQIYDGTLKEGDALPSMRQLAKDLKVSVITTKRAYEDLENEGYVVSAVGKGTFVAGQQPHVLREWQMREIENQLEQLVKHAKTIGLSKQEFIELLNIYYEEND